VAVSAGVSFSAIRVNADNARRTSGEETVLEKSDSGDKGFQEDDEGIGYGSPDSGCAGFLLDRREEIWISRSFWRVSLYFARRWGLIWMLLKDAGATGLEPFIFLIYFWWSLWLLFSKRGDGSSEG